MNIGLTGWLRRPVVLGVIQLVVVGVMIQSAAPGLAQLKKPGLGLPETTPETLAAERALNGPVDLELRSATLERALLEIARELRCSIRIDLTTLVNRTVALSAPAPSRLTGETLRSALQQLFSSASSADDRPIPVFSHEGAIQIDECLRLPAPRGRAPRQGRWIVHGRVLDEQGKAVPRAAVLLNCWTWVVMTVADDDGRFVATLGTGGKLTIQAWDGSGRLRGWQNLGHESVEVNKRIAPVLTVKAPRSVTVRVTESGQPVERAQVVLIGGGYPYDAPPTTAVGESMLQIPADLEADAIVAWKQGIGFDYVAARMPGTVRGGAEPLLSTGQPIDLQLSRGPVARFRIVDQFGHPVAHSPFTPWSFNNLATGAPLRLFVLHGRHVQRTDAEGFISFDWLPAWQQDSVPFAGWGKSISRTDVELPPWNANLRTVRVERNTAVRGRVFGIDGRPAGDVYVFAHGGGFQNRTAARSGVADHRGHFELDVPAAQAYLIVAMSRDGQLISAPEERILEEPNRAVDDVDLYLRPAIRVFGRAARRDIEVGRSQPVLKLVGDDLNLRSDVRLTRDASLIPVRAVEEIDLEVGRMGEFQTFVGPGRYEFAPRGDALVIPFELTEQTEYEIVVPSD